MNRLFLVAMVIGILPWVAHAQPASPANPLTVQATGQSYPQLFTDKEHSDIVAYWNVPGRYTFSAPSDVSIHGPYRVHLTPEGSQWLASYEQIVAGKTKLPPSMHVQPTSGPYAPWEAWISARLAYEWHFMQQAADRMNAPVISSKETGAGQNDRNLPQKSINQQVTVPPTAPGPIPPDLFAACGNPPAFASVVSPQQYLIHFDDPDETYTYTDNVILNPRFTYYRFPKGVLSNGTDIKDLPPSERDELFRASGLSPSEQRIYSAVSPLEGGFDTVQSYDTGFVSIGFIQFVTLAEGKHDLSEVLRVMKEERPDDYKNDFHRFGIDLQADKTLTVVDPSSGIELTGSAAVLKIIDDKRLIAVFQRAGRRPGFRIAQIKVAKSFYWPANDMVNATLRDGTVLSGKVCDCVKSEAGIACLLDRKINIGNIRIFNDIALRIATSHKCKTIADLALYEKEIITALKHRADFLVDTTLGQPTPPPQK